MTDDPVRVRQASDRLEDIEQHASVDPKITRDVEVAVSKRIKKLALDRTIGDIHESEIITRAYEIKEAHRRLEGLLRAFVSASYRHGKTE